MSNVSLESILGVPLKDYVKRQFAVRSSKIINDFSDEAIKFKANKSGWIRAISSVRVNDPAFLKTLGMSESLLGDGLAKNYVLFGGVSKYKETQTPYYLRNPENTGDKTGFLYSERRGLDAYEMLSQRETSQFGYSPMPGILNAKIDTQGRLGSIKQATITFRVNNKSQLDVIDALYFRPGYSILLEWGNTIYYSPKTLQSGDKIPTDINSQYELNSSEDLFIDPFDDGMDMDAIRSKIVENNLKSSGNYDGMIGLITQYNFSRQIDGSYTCTLTAVGLGALGESMRMNNAASIYPESLKYLIKALIDVKQAEKKRERERAINSLLESRGLNAPVQTEIQIKDFIQNKSSEFRSVDQTKIRFANSWGKILDDYVLQLNNTNDKSFVIVQKPDGNVAALPLSAGGGTRSAYDKRFTGQINFANLIGTEGITNVSLYSGPTDNNKMSNIASLTVPLDVPFVLGAFQAVAPDVTFVAIDRLFENELDGLVRPIVTDYNGVPAKPQTEATDPTGGAIYSDVKASAVTAAIQSLEFKIGWQQEGNTFYALIRTARSPDVISTYTQGKRQLTGNVISKFVTNLYADTDYNFDLVATKFGLAARESGDDAAKEDPGNRYGIVTDQIKGTPAIERSFTDDGFTGLIPGDYTPDDSGDAVDVFSVSRYDLIKNILLKLATGLDGDFYVDTQTNNPTYTFIAADKIEIPYTDGLKRQFNGDSSYPTVANGAAEKNLFVRKQFITISIRTNDSRIITNINPNTAETNNIATLAAQSNVKLISDVATPNKAINDARAGVRNEVNNSIPLLDVSVITKSEANKYNSHLELILRSIQLYTNVLTVGEGNNQSLLTDGKEISNPFSVDFNSTQKPKNTEQAGNNSPKEFMFSLFGNGALEPIRGISRVSEDETSAFDVNSAGDMFDINSPAISKTVFSKMDKTEFKEKDFLKNYKYPSEALFGFSKAFMSLTSEDQWKKIVYHLNKASNSTDSSQVDPIPGIQPGDKKNLLKSFLIPYAQSQTAEDSVALNYPCYIPLGFFFMIINHVSLIYEDKTRGNSQSKFKNKPLVYLDFNDYTTTCLTHPSMLSSDPYKFMIPFEGTMDDYKKLFEDVVLDPDPNKNNIKGTTDIKGKKSESIPLFDPIQGNDVTKYLNEKGINFKKDVKDGGFYRGNVLKVLVNIDYLLKVIRNKIDQNETNTLLLRSLLEEVVADMNKCLGSFNYYRLAYSDESNCFYLSDDQRIPEKDKVESLEKYYTIPLHGKYSIAETYEIKTEISNRLSNLVAISANSEIQATAGRDASAFGENGRFKFQDRYKPIVMSVNDFEKITLKDFQALNQIQQESYAKEKKLSIEQITEELQRQQDIANTVTNSTIEAAQQFNEAVRNFYGDGGKDKKKSVRFKSTEQKAQLATNYLVNRMAKVKAKDVHTRSSALIPISINFTTDGISGLNVGSAFDIDENLIPASYKNLNNRKIVFVITGLDHTIDGNRWKTNVRANMMYSNEAVIEKEELKLNGYETIKDEASKGAGPVNVNLNYLDITSEWSKIATVYIAKNETFTRSATWDVNAYRLGYGTDIIMLDDGTTRKVEVGDTTTEENAAKVLQSDILDRFYKRLVGNKGYQLTEEEFEKLSEPAKAALISYCYNVGSLRLKIAQAIKNNDYVRAAEFIKEGPITDREGTVYPGLIRRRAEESELFLK